jgi:hypothetical protein
VTEAGLVAGGIVIGALIVWLTAILIWRAVSSE